MINSFKRIDKIINNHCNFLMDGINVQSWPQSSEIISRMETF